MAQSSSAEVAVVCGNCEKPLQPNESPCKGCGSTRRRYNVTLTANLVFSRTTLKAVGKTPSGFKKFEQTVRDKIGGASKWVAREILSFDRTDPNATKKTHVVEEQNPETGEWITKHDEHKTFPARRRKPTA